ncbi:MAG: M28 family metallopeptidase [Lentisphaerota bacterium]
MASVSGSLGQTDLLLGRVNISGSVSQFPLPVYSHVQDASGQDYVLVKATAAELKSSALAVQILDTNIESSVYILAHEFRAGARQAAQGKFQIVHDDGKRLIIRASSENETDQLADFGFQCRPLRSEPIRFEQPSSPNLLSFRKATTVNSNALVSEMVWQVKQTNLYMALSDLTGLQPVVAGGSYTNIRTRFQNSGTPLRRATELAFEKFNALGLQPSYQNWSSSGISGRNVIGSLTGASTPSEIIVLCAHIDDVPASGNAPGADDNASGSLGVLAAAEIMRKYSFERTIRFILFTGEEAGLYGSEAYAQAADTAGDDIVAVLNLDMLAWDGNGDKKLHLYTRATSSPGYTNDLDIAATFTNVVRTYGLHTGIVTRIIAEYSDWSDHASFLDHGFSAICAIEEDLADFNPYYHTANDTISNIHIPYYTFFVQGVVGATAHLAHPAGRVEFDSIKVQSGPFQADTTVGVGTFVARHESGAAEGADSYDAAWSGMATNPNASWLKIFSEPYSSGLAIDARPTNSETIYRGKLAAVKTSAGSFTCTNQLKFEYACGSSTDCAYMVKVTVASNYTTSAAGFSCVTNLSQLIADGGFIHLPELNALTNGTVYGTCEISRRFIAPASSNLALQITRISPAGASWIIPSQLGTVNADELEVATNLFPLAQWFSLSVFTNNPAPDEASFESGWKNVQMNAGVSALSNSPSRYYRVKRSRLTP